MLELDGRQVQLQLTMFC